LPGRQLNRWRRDAGIFMPATSTTVPLRKFVAPRFPPPPPATPNQPLVSEPGRPLLIWQKNDQVHAWLDRRRRIARGTRGPAPKQLASVGLSQLQSRAPSSACSACTRMIGFTIFSKPQSLPPHPAPTPFHHAHALPCTRRRWASGTRWQAWPPRRSRRTPRAASWAWSRGSCKNSAAS